MKSLFVFGLLLLAAASTSEAKPQKIVIPPGWGNGKGYYAPTFYMAFKKAGLKRWTALVDRAGLRRYFSDPRLKITAWPPMDYAFDEILKDIGCTFPQLLKNKVLVRQLVLYHTTPGMRVFTSYWPKWPKAKYIPSGLTALGQKGKWLKIEMDDQKTGNPDDDWKTYDIDGSDDDAELEEPIIKYGNHLIGIPTKRNPGGLMSIIDDVMTYKGLKKQWKNSLKKHRG